MVKLKSTKIGIVITSKGIRGVETTNGQIVKTSKILFDAEIVPSVHDSEYETFLEKYLHQLVVEMGIKKKTQCVVVIDGQQLQVKPFKMFDMPVEAMKENIQTEMEEALPKTQQGYEYGCRVVKSLPADEGGAPQVLVLGVALDRALSLMYSIVFSRAGLNLVRIDLAENVRLKLIDIACLWQEFKAEEVVSSSGGSLLAKYGLGSLEAKLGFLNKGTPKPNTELKTEKKIDSSPKVDAESGLKKRKKPEVIEDTAEFELELDFGDDGDFVLDIDEEDIDEDAVSWQSFDADANLSRKRNNDMLDNDDFPLDDDDFIVFKETGDTSSETFSDTLGDEDDVQKGELDRGADSYLIRSRDTFAVLDITDYNLNLSLYVKGEFYVERHIMPEEVISTDAEGNVSLNVESLTSEISSVLDFMAYNVKDSKIDRLLLFGPDEEVQDIIPRLEDLLNLVVIDAVQELHWDPFGALEVYDPGEYLAAYGATIVPKSGKDFTLVKEIKTKSSVGINKLNLGIIITFLVAAAGLGLTYFVVNTNYETLQHQYDQGVEQLIYVDVSIETLEILEDYARQMREIVGNVRGFSEDYITLVVLYESIIKDHPEGIVVTGIKNDLNAIGIDGIADSVQHLMHYIFFLEKQEVFDRIDTRTTVQNDAGKLRFELSAYVSVNKEGS